MNKRDEIIKKALVDKLSGNISIYSADDILTVADISEEEMWEFHNKFKIEIDNIAKKKKKYEEQNA